MATAPGTLPRGATENLKDSRSKQDRRRDRITGILALVVIVALMALMILLATLGNGEWEGVNDYWPMMP